MLLLWIGGCGGSSLPKAQPAAANSDSGDTYRAGEVSGIRTVKIEVRPIPDYVQLPGQIEPDPTRVIRVFPPAGGRITEMKVRPWDRVEKGQVIAILDSADLSRALSDYQKARADNDVKQKQLARSEDLLAHHAIAERDYQQAQADAFMAQAELKSATDQLRVLGADPAAPTSSLRVMAPRSGVVLDIGAAPGEFSKSLDASQPLCTIADLNQVWAVGDAFEKDIVGLKSGDRATISPNAYPGQTWTGRVGVLSDVVDPTTRTMKVRVVISNSGLRLKPGMFATLRLLRSQSSGILIPISAVVRNGAAAYVFVQKGDGHYERRGIALGRTIGDEMEVTSGLQPGESIVSEGALLLRQATSGTS